MHHYHHFSNFPVIINIYILCGALYTSYFHTFVSSKICRQLKLRSCRNYANSWKHVPVYMQHHRLNEIRYQIQMIKSQNIKTWIALKTSFYHQRLNTWKTNIFMLIYNYLQQFFWFWHISKKCIYKVIITKRSNIHTILQLICLITITH